VTILEEFLLGSKYQKNNNSGTFQMLLTKAPGY